MSGRRWPVPAEMALASALGALQTLAYAHTAWWPLPGLALALLVWRLDGAPPRRAAWLGWCYGTAWLAAGTGWLYISLHVYGGLPALLALLAVLALAAALSLYLALACAGYARWRRGTAGDAALFAALCLLAELARGVIFTGFPWLALGYSQVDAPLAALAPWVGVYGIGALLAAAAAALVQGVCTKGRLWQPGAALVLATAAAGIAHGAYTQPAGEISVALLQSNVSQDEKFAADRMPETLAWTAREMRAAAVDLVLGPETVVPLLPAQLADLAPGYWEALRAQFSVPGRAALFGVPLGDFETGYTNSVVGFSGTSAYRYDKTHLVPFGEFVPQGFHWFTEMMDIPLGDFNRGAVNPPSFAVRGQRVAPNICYEDLFGEELARRFIDPARAPTIFANVSNIAWFGPSAINAQHLNISRLRTLEFQLPMIRSTNTGATAIIDHRGVVTAHLAPYTRGVLQGRVQGRAGVTPYAWWTARVGLWPLGLGATLVVVACARRRRPVRAADA